MIQDVDTYLEQGCGRCPLGGTPDCKVHRWTEELTLLRSIVLDCGLTEEIKWSVPCYTYQGGNVLIVGAFKEYCSISFFKGALLEDAAFILEKPGENTQAGRLIRFTGVDEIRELESNVKAHIHEAIEVEKSGLEVEYKRNPEPIPDELQAKFDEDPYFRAAFEALTPGRQRGYILFVSGAKQSKTRSARIEKHMERILEGKGLHD